MDVCLVCLSTDMCIDMRINMFTGMCIDMTTCKDACTDMCGTCKDACTDMCVDR